jgi:leader peptidase (prepilin peptidase)/N-methyltransferase
MILLFAVVFGATIGSFLNVVIARLPRQESLIAPGSRCPACASPIRWFDNIPLFSFVWLRRRCRRCDAPIAWRYLVVESLTAALFVLSAWKIGWRLELAPAWVLLASLIAIAAIDLEHQIIPDAITLPGIVVGFAFSLATASPPWLDSLLGVLVGGAIPFAVIVASRGGMGGGDMKLAAMIGAFLGWKLAVLTIFLAVLLGGTTAAALLIGGLRRRKDRIPFGPFLACSAVVSLFWGEALLRWYWSGFAP